MNKKEAKIKIKFFFVYFVLNYNPLKDKGDSLTTYSDEADHIDNEFDSDVETSK